MNKNNTLMIVIVGLIVVLGLGYFLTRGNSTQESMQETGEEVVMDEGEKDEMIQSLMENPDTLIAELADVSGGSSSGTGYVLRADTLTHEVVADLPDPAEGLAYEGWLVQQTPLQFFSTGVLKKNADGMYALSFSSDEMSEGYDFVVITLETEVDETPEEHILEGTAQ